MLLARLIFVFALHVMIKSLTSFSASFRFLVKKDLVIRNIASSDDTVISRCTKNITDLLHPVKLIVTSTNDDPNGSHIRVECVSEQFQGKSIVQRQKLVYKAIWDELNGPVHAVDSIVAKTPKEAGIEDSIKSRADSILN